MMRQTITTCHELRAHLSLWLDGELDATRCAQAQRHLAGCPACRNLADTLRQMLALYRAAPRAVVPAAVHARLAQIFELKGNGDG